MRRSIDLGRRCRRNVRRWKRITERRKKSKVKNYQI
jgi:hypothetical protein